ncbi:unnamed protein product [marine sediment metagenome]|uniref:Endonuclease V n=1 Tax=marine sediment metagenome TaxID=412755 RepID=X0YFN3_9ZZZZ
MTRINVVPVQELTNKHLMAEYRELPRSMRRAVLAAYKGKQPGDVKIAPEYKLGTGHELFFVDKCKWLYDRWVLLRDELLKRGYNLSDQFQQIVIGRARHIRKHAKQFYGEYLPTGNARMINRQRIAERLS